MSQTVLVVESESWLGDHYVRTLEKYGYQTRYATNGFTAIDMIDDELPGVIIMSLLLSGTGGLGLLHELQTYIDTAKIPIIVCSSRTVVTLEELQPYGVRLLLDSKLMKPDDIVAAVRSVLA